MSTATAPIVLSLEGVGKAFAALAQAQASQGAQYEQCMAAVAQSPENTSCVVQATSQGVVTSALGRLRTHAINWCTACQVNLRLPPDRLLRSHHGRWLSWELLRYLVNEDLNDDHEVSVPRPLRQQLEAWAKEASPRADETQTIINAFAKCGGRGGPGTTFTSREERQIVLGVSA